MGDPLVQEYQDFIRNNLEVIKYQPNMIQQVILNEPQDSVLRQAPLIHSDVADDGMILLELKNKPKSKEERAKNGQVISKTPRNPPTFILPTKKVLFTGFVNGSILVSDSQSLEDLYCLVSHSDEITGLALLSKNVLMSTSKDGLLCSWDLERRIRLESVKAHERALVSLSVRAPSIVTAGWDGVIKIWNKNLVSISSISPSLGPINCVMLHPRKELCITGGWDNTIRIWDLQTLKSRAVIRGHESSVQSIKLTQDYRKIISGSLDGEVKVWDSSVGVEVASFNTGHGLSHLEVDNDQQVLHVGHNSGVVTTWPLALGRQVSSIKDQDLTCDMWSAFNLETHPSIRKMEATTLSRTVSAMHQLGSLTLLGFDNGDVQIVKADDKCVENVNGWKVFTY